MITSLLLVLAMKSQHLDVPPSVLIESHDASESIKFVDKLIKPLPVPLRERHHTISIPPISDSQVREILASEKMPGKILKHYVLNEKWSSRNVPGGVVWVGGVDAFTAWNNQFILGNDTTTNLDTPLTAGLQVFFTNYNVDPTGGWQRAKHGRYLVIFSLGALPGNQYMRSFKGGPVVCGTTTFNGKSSPATYIHLKSGYAAYAAVAFRPSADIAGVTAYNFVGQLISPRVDVYFVG